MDLDIFDGQLCEMIIVFLALLVACSGDKCQLDCVPSLLASMCVLPERTPDHLYTKLGDSCRKAAKLSTTAARRWSTPDLSM